MIITLCILGYFLIAIALIINHFNELGEERQIKKRKNVRYKKNTMNYQEAFSKASKINDELTAYNFPQANLIIVHVEEGAVYQLPESFIRTEGPWIMVFSEHNSYHVFHRNTLLSCKELNIVKSWDCTKPFDYSGVYEDIEYG